MTQSDLGEGLSHMKGDYVSKLIVDLESAFPEESYPEIAASVCRLREAHDKELRTKQAYKLLGIDLPTQNKSPPSQSPLV